MSSLDVYSVVEFEIPASFVPLMQGGAAVIPYALRVLFFHPVNKVVTPLPT